MVKVVIGQPYARRPAFCQGHAGAEARPPSRVRGDAIRDKLAAIKTIKYRDVDYETAKKEVMGYFQERGEAYPSQIEEDLELDYKLICQIVDELKREGRLEIL